MEPSRVSSSYVPLPIVSLFFLSVLGKVTLSTWLSYVGEQSQDMAKYLLDNLQDGINKVLLTPSPTSHRTRIWVSCTEVCGNPNPNPD